MRIIINLFKPQDEKNKNNKNIKNENKKKLNLGSLKNYLTLNVIVITIPIISYCTLYAWKYYKKTKRIIDDYLECYLNKLKEKIKAIRNRLEVERVKNCNLNLKIELDIYKYFDLNLCLEILHIKNELDNRFLFIKNPELINHKINAIHGDVFEEYYCYFNEIKRKNKFYNPQSINIIEEQLDISYKKVLEIIEDHKEYLIDLNDYIINKDFYTREKYEQENKLSFYDLFNITKILDYLNVFKYFKNQKEEIRELSNETLNLNTSINNKDLLDELNEENTNKFTIPNKDIIYYTSAFLFFAKIIIGKLERILIQNNIDLCDQINIHKDIKNYTKCLLSNANDFILEKYKIPMKNLLPVIAQNNCFKDEKIIYYFEELKSYLIKFGICLIDV